MEHLQYCLDYVRTRGGLCGQFVNWKRVMDGVHMYVLGGLYGQVVTGNKVPHS